MDWRLFGEKLMEEIVSFRFQCWKRDIALDTPKIGIVWRQ